jgi:GWxTD domain-containing protein
LQKKVVEKKRFKALVYIGLLLTACLTILVTTCRSPYVATGTRWNLSAIYNPASSEVHPAFRVFHNSDNTSLLLVKLFPSELLFNQANVEGEFISKVSVQVQNYEIKENKTTLIDSMTYYYSIKQDNVGKRFLAQIPIKTEMGKRYQVRVVTRDLLRKDFNLRFIDVDKTSEYSEQNFNVLNQNGIPYFDNVIPPGAICRIQHRNTVHEKVFIKYFKNQLPLPKPVFAVSPDEILFDKPDSIYVIDYSVNVHFSFNQEGYYHFRFDTNQAEGLTLLNLGEDYPKVKSAKDLLEPLAYITTSGEYANLLKGQNTKLTVDNFWLNIGKSTSKSKELIRIYYNRVYFANYYFTTNKPGWKTDKGMVYIVYGPPQNMQKTPNSEIWLYYTKGATNTISFTFVYKPTPYSIDNFYLQRTESQDWHWREAVDAWQRGQIYLSE